MKLNHMMMHQRSKSHDLVITNNSGFLSPKVEEATNLSRVSEGSTNSVQVGQMQLQMQQKDELIEELQLQLSQLLEGFQGEINQVRNESRKVIDAQIKQIFVYKQQLRFSNEQAAALRVDIQRIRNREKQVVQINHQLERENQALLGKVDQLRAEMSINNQVSVIEKQCDITQFEKTFKWMADELTSYSVLDGVRSSHNNLNNYNSNNINQVRATHDKFIKCLKELVLSCAPLDYFENADPSLKEIWKFIKQILSTYVENKKTQSFLYETVNTLCRYLNCNEDQLCHQTAGIVCDFEVMARVCDKVKQLLQIQVNINIRELERQIDRYIN